MLKNYINSDAKIKHVFPPVFIRLAIITAATSPALIHLLSIICRQMLAHRDMAKELFRGKHQVLTHYYQY